MAGEFDSAVWVERLTDALTGLSEAQEHFADQLDEGRATYSSGKQVDAIVDMVHIRSDVLLALFHTAFFGMRSGEEARFVRLRLALNPVLELLAAHPALAGVLTASGGNQQFVLLLPDHAVETDLFKMVGGLIGRAMDLPDDGCRVACRELEALLNSDGERETRNQSGSLRSGFHVALFHGLRFKEEAVIADGMTVQPFEKVAGFVNEGVLREISQSIVTSDRKKSIGAIVKPFHWKPEFRPPVDHIEIDSDWGGSFREDAEAFIELLAVSHAAPAVCLVTIHHCIQQVAAGILGDPHYRGGYTWGRSARSFDRLANSRVVSRDAFFDAQSMFLGRERTRYRKLAPIVSRLAEAQARSGRFADEDRILDVAIALERIYELDSGEISHKLRTRAAWYLGVDTESRIRESKAVKQLYDARSAVVHNRKGKSSLQENREAFSKGFDIARRSLFKLLREGPPEDWNALVVAGR